MTSKLHNTMQLYPSSWSNNHIFLKILIHFIELEKAEKKMLKRKFRSSVRMRWTSPPRLDIRLSIRPLWEKPRVRIFRWITCRMECLTAKRRQMEISLNTQVQILLIELCFKSRSRLSPLFEGNARCRILGSAIFRLIKFYNSLWAGKNLYMT